MSCLLGCCGDASNVLDDSLYTAWLDLELEKEELGHGQYGTVHRATNKLTRGHFAVKVCHKAKIASKAEELALLNEVDILRRLNHPNIIRFYDMHDTEADFFIVTELVSGGELFDRIIEREHYSEKEARDCARVLLEAISYLHHHSASRTATSSPRTCCSRRRRTTTRSSSPTSASRPSAATARSTSRAGRPTTSRPSCCAARTTAWRSTCGAAA